MRLPYYGFTMAQSGDPYPFLAFPFPNRLRRFGGRSLGPRHLRGKSLGPRSSGPGRSGGRFLRPRFRAAGDKAALLPFQRL